MKKIYLTIIFLALLLQAQNEVCFEMYVEPNISDYKVLYEAAELLDNDKDEIVNQTFLAYWIVYI